ncbi:STAS domain-containing protein [Blastococcus sp. SYSU D00820]
MDDAPSTARAATGPDAEDAPEVGLTVAGDSATVTVDGELTEQARKPLVRTVTDLLLSTHSLRTLRLDLRSVAYTNSAGMALLVQVQKLAQPRGIELVLVDPPTAVTRPLQMTGLWHRFLVEEPAGGGPEPAGPPAGAHGDRPADRSH